VLSSKRGADSGALAAVDPSLATLIGAWPDLPKAIKAGILAMVNAAGCRIEE
jgi:hypothetical protein